jgi:hypothetical protein
MKKWLSVCLATLIAFGTTAASVEAKEAKDPEATFQRKDTNGDGQLSLSEFLGKGKKNKGAKKNAKKKANNGGKKKAKKNGKKKAGGKKGKKAKKNKAN